MTVVAPPTLQSMHAILRLQRVSLSFTVDVMVFPTSPKAKPCRSLLRSNPRVLKIFRPGTLLMLSPAQRRLAALFADSWVRKREWQWLPRLRSLSQASTARWCLAGFHWRTASVWSMIRCLDGEQCCTHLFGIVQLKVTQELQGLLDSIINVQHRRPARIWSLVVAAVPQRLVRLSHASLVPIEPSHFMSALTGWPRMWLGQCQGNGGPSSAPIGAGDAP